MNDFEFKKKFEDYREGQALTKIAEEKILKILADYELKAIQVGLKEKFGSLWKKLREEGLDPRIRDLFLNIPDKLIIKEFPKSELFLADIKGKKKGFLINERAYRNYLIWAKVFGLPVYLLIWHEPSDQSYAVKIPFKIPGEEKRAWDENLVLTIPQENLEALEEFLSGKKDNHWLNL